MRSIAPQGTIPSSCQKAVDHSSVEQFNRSFRRRIAHVGGSAPCYQAKALTVLGLLSLAVFCAGDASWQQKVSTGGPAGLQFHRAVRAYSGIIAVGGVEVATGTFSSSVFRYSSITGAWSSAVADAQVKNPAVGAVSGGVVVSGGSFPNGTVSAATFIVDEDSLSWRRLTPATSPSSRSDACGSADGNSKMMLFGGTDSFGSILGDTWILDADLGTWQSVSSIENPSARTSAACSYDMRSKSVWLSGGTGVSGLSSSDVWQFSFDSLQWSRKALAVSGAPGLSSLAIRHGRLLTGISAQSSQAFGKLWVFDSVEQNWRELSYSGGGGPSLIGASIVPGSNVGSQESSVTIIGGQSSDLQVWVVTADSCPVGQFSTTGMTPCSACSQGSYSDRIESKVCTLCASGSTTGATGAVSASMCGSPCAFGSYSNTGVAPCSPCSAGSFQPFTGQKSCLTCPQGYSTPSAGSISSVDCVANPQCTAGSYSAVGLEPCDACPQGFYASTVGSTSCSACPAGTSTASHGSTSVSQCKTICPAGSFSSTGVTPCTLCPAGTHSGSLSTNCTSCGLGFTTNSTGAVSADACVLADACQPGYYSTSGRTDSTCMPCPKDHFSSSELSTQCSACPEGQTSSEGASECQQEEGSQFDLMMVLLILGGAAGVVLLGWLISWLRTRSQKRAEKKRIQLLEEEAARAPVGFIRFGDNQMRQSNRLANASKPKPAWSTSIADEEIDQQSPSAFSNVSPGGVSIRQSPSYSSRNLLSASPGEVDGRNDSPSPLASAPIQRQSSLTSFQSASDLRDRVKALKKVGSKYSNQARRSRNSPNGDESANSGTRDGSKTSAIPASSTPAPFADQVSKVNKGTVHIIAWFETRKKALKMERVPSLAKLRSLICKAFQQEDTPLARLYLKQKQGTELLLSSDAVLRSAVQEANGEPVELVLWV